MSIVGNNKKIINFIGEISGNIHEKEFFENDMEKSIKYIKPIILILGILNTLFLIPDYFFINNSDSFRLIALLRFSFVFLVLILYVRINHIKTFGILAYWITAYEILAVIILLLVLFQYESPNFLIQALGIIIILFGIFIIPNRWIYSIVASLIDSLSFILLSKYYISDLKTSEFWAGVVYIFLVLIMCCIYSYRNHYYKRINFLNNKELLRFSITDSLTGAFNRAKFNQELEKWTSYSQRYKVPVSLIFLDIDNFKSINDNYGHPCGDKVIIELVNLISNNIRETDLCARWGGDELAIILPNIDNSNAYNFAERLRIMIMNKKFEEVEIVTCSFGVIEISLGESIDSMICRVDRRLYSAKAAGKNIVKN